MLLVHPLMIAPRNRFESPTLRWFALAAPVPGIVGALIFHAWTLALVAWVVLAARELDRPRQHQS